MPKSKLGYKIFTFCLAVMKPVLAPIFWILDKIYDVFFRPGDLRKALERNEKFGQEVQSKLPFLFAEYGGVLSSYAVKEPSSFHGAVTRVVLPEFILQFSRGRGDFQVRIAPKQAPDELLDIFKLFSIVDKPFEDRLVYSFEDLKAALEPRMRLLHHVMGPAHYSKWRPWLPFASSQREIERRLQQRLKANE
jgi:hypothetical protein